VSGRFERDEREWLEADGLGGFASGTVSGVRTRRYHALLLAATTPPTGRMVLVNGFDAWVETPGGARHAITTQHYAPDVRHPDGAAAIEAFTTEPWPTWTFALPGGLRVRQEIFAPHEQGATIVTWRLADRGATAAEKPVRLVVRPFLSGRDYHATHHENGSVRRDADLSGDTVTWHVYDGVPGVVSGANAIYRHDPDWYRHCRYTAESRRGLDDLEDVFAPGWLTFDLSAGEAVWFVAPIGAGAGASGVDVVAVVHRLREQERTRRAAFASPLHRAADAYLVRRGRGRTIVAGYPWFTDWGRDTFIAIRGLCLATGRVDEARDILLEWATVVSEGMLPNRFPDGDAPPEFNAVDASLWFVVAVRELLDAADRGDATVAADQRTALLDAVLAIVDGHARGTRYGIRMDADGLLACGEPGVQLTWMDAKVGDRVVTPRTGKPVEVQVLWLHALGVAGAVDARWLGVERRGREAFRARFWHAEGGYLYDVVDVDHEPGRVDATFRPNQIFAIGALAGDLLAPSQARSIVEQVEARLLTPIGLRSLAPGEPGYVAHYGGGPSERDAQYHQGTVWPWLLGPFVEAWLAVSGNTPGAAADASRRFLAPLRTHLLDAGLGHVSEIADAEAPFTPAGCPFQAWSVGELLRIEARLDRIAAAPMAAVGPVG
jgi:predicted glycogen debranching enzyme